MSVNSIIKEKSEPNVINNKDLPLHPSDENLPREKVERTDEINNKINELILSNLNKAELKEWYRIKINGRFISIEDSRWPSEKTAINALNKYLRHSALYNIRQQLLPNYIYIPDIIRQSYERARYAVAYRYHSYGDYDLRKDVNNLIKSGVIEIVKQLEM